MAELIPIAAPAEQAEGTEMVVGSWLKQVGESVTENEPLLEITTDKVTVEIAAPATGILREILKSADQPIQAGEVLGRIEVGAVEAGRCRGDRHPERSEGPLGARVECGRGAPAAAELTAAVRRLLAEHGLEPSAISGTGRGGRITVQDVEAHVASRAGTPTKPELGAYPSRKVPHTGMRRSIAQHMVQSVAVAPHVTTVFEADLSAIAAHREASAVKLTYTAYFVRASVAALQAVPEVNSRWHDDALELFDDCNIGVATAAAAASSCRSSTGPRRSTCGQRGR